MAADDFIGSHDSAIDLDDASWDSELEVSETQFETLEAGGMSSENECDSVLAIGHCRSVAHHPQVVTQITEIRSRELLGVLVIGHCRSVAPDSCQLR